MYTYILSIKENTITVPKLEHGSCSGTKRTEINIKGVDLRIRPDWLKCWYQETLVVLSQFWFGCGYDV